MSTSEDLTINRALKPAGSVLLGYLTAKQLEANGACAYFINQSGTIEIVPPVELGMDYLPEEQALHILLHQHQYTDDQLMAYLKGREARSPRGEGGTNATNL